MPKFAANLSTMFNELPFLARFDAAAAAGFKGVEFLFPYEYPPEMLRNALGNTAAGEWGTAAIPRREAEARRDIDLALEYALALNCQQVHIMAGVVPPGAERETYCRTFIDNVRYAAEQFAPHGVRILLEALNPRTKPNYLYQSQYQTIEILRRIDRPGAYLQLDLFHAQLVDGNLSHLITDYVDTYRHIQIASAPDRHEPDEGEINYPWIFELIDRSGYPGWIGCEYFSRATTQEGVSWFDSWK